MVSIHSPLGRRPRRVCSSAHPRVLAGFKKRLAAYFLVLLMDIWVVASAGCWETLPIPTACQDSLHQRGLLDAPPKIYSGDTKQDTQTPGTKSQQWYMCVWGLPGNLWGDRKFSGIGWFQPAERAWCRGTGWKEAGSPTSTPQGRLGTSLPALHRWARSRPFRCVVH